MDKFDKYRYKFDKYGYKFGKYTALAQFG